MKQIYIKLTTLISLFSTGFYVGVNWNQAQSKPVTKQRKTIQTSPQQPDPRTECTDLLKPNQVEIDVLTSKLKWYEGRLKSLTAPRPTGRYEWPEEIDDSHSPDVWNQEVDDLIENCNISATPISTDCVEYPCVTMLRPTGDYTSGEELRSALNACTDIPDSFTESEQYATSVIVNCPDGTQEEAFVLAMSSEDVLRQIYDLEEEETLTFSQYVMHAGRRVESAIDSWECSEELP